MSVLSVLAASLLLSQASMNGETVPATPLDPRVSACGLRIERAEMATLTPFIETRQPLSGRVSVQIAKRSAGGTANVTQERAFSGGSLDLSIAVDRPSQTTVSMRIIDQEGTLLCRMEEDLDLAEAPRNI